MAETIFILGAGASIPYGFPSGERLVQLVMEKLQILINESKNIRNDWLAHILRTGKGIDGDLCERFSHALQKSSAYSIDAFLENRPEFRSIGKFIIASILLDYERKCKNGNELYSSNNDENWYRYFFNEIKHLQKFNFKIYTFNYDRSLEYFLYYAYKYFFDLPAETIFGKIKSMNITHLHGSLGNIDNADGFMKFQFGNNDHINTYSELQFISEGIDILYEVNGNRLNGLREDINIASNLVFIGFGFDKTNMRNIGLREIKFYENEHMIWATTYKLSKNEVNHRFLSNITPLKRLVNGQMVSEINNIVKTSNETALQFLKNTLPHSIYS